MNRKIFNIMFNIMFILSLIFAIIVMVVCLSILFTFVEHGIPFIVEWLETTKVFIYI